MKPIYAFNDYLFEIWPLDKYARSHLNTILEQEYIDSQIIPTTMGTEAFKFSPENYRILKEHLTG